MSGLRVQALRRKNKWTREELAEKAGVTLRTVVNWEKARSKPSPHHEKVLKEIFGEWPE